MSSQTEKETDAIIGALCLFGVVVLILLSGVIDASRKPHRAGAEAPAILTVPDMFAGEIQPRRDPGRGNPLFPF